GRSHASSRYTHHSHWTKSSAEEHAYISFSWEPPPSICNSQSAIQNIPPHACGPKSTISVPIVSGTPYGRSCEVLPKLLAEPYSLKIVLRCASLFEIVHRLAYAFHIRPVLTIMIAAMIPPTTTPTQNDSIVYQGPSQTPIAIISLTSPAPM